MTKEFSALFNLFNCTKGKIVINLQAVKKKSRFWKYNKSEILSKEEPIEEKKDKKTSMKVRKQNLSRIIYKKK